MALKIRWSVPRLHARPVDRGAAARSDDLCGNAARRGGVRPNICRRWSLAVGAEHIPATRKPVLEVAAPVGLPLVVMRCVAARPSRAPRKAYLDA
jgi:hypothetical protein